MFKKKKYCTAFADYKGKLENLDMQNRRQYLGTQNMDGLVGEIVENYDSLYKHTIIPVLFPLEGNEETIKNSVPYKVVADFAVVFEIYMKEGAFYITNAIFNKLGKSVDEIYDQAVSNIPGILDPKFAFVTEEIEIEGHHPRIASVVLPEKPYASSCILSSDIMDYIAGELNADEFYFSVIKSNSLECVYHPVTEVMGSIKPDVSGYPELEDKPDAVLSARTYRYDAKEHTITYGTGTD